MDWKALFLTADGRIGQRDFWIGFAILFVAGFILGLIPLLGIIISIAMIYPNVCVTAKRLHDMGRSGWLMLVPWAVSTVAFMVAMFSGGAALMGAAAGGSGGGMASMAGLGVALVAGCVALLVGLGFLLWVGLSKGEPGDNRFGPPPISLTGGANTQGTIAS
jgi:uncharacterized membrane protein YhaH (DUF805 family)